MLRSRAAAGTLHLIQRSDSVLNRVTPLGGIRLRERERERKRPPIHQRFIENSFREWNRLRIRARRLRSLERTKLREDVNRTLTDD